MKLLWLLLLLATAEVKALNLRVGANWNEWLSSLWNGVAGEVGSPPSTTSANKSFKESLTLEQRKAKFNELAKSDNAAVILEKAQGSSLGDMHNKFVSPKSTTCGDFLDHIRSKLTYPPQRLYVFSENGLCPKNTKIGDLYDKHKDKEDGFLYLEYSEHPSYWRRAVATARSFMPKSWPSWPSWPSWMSKSQKPASDKVSDLPTNGWTKVTVLLNGWLSYSKYTKYARQDATISDLKAEFPSVSKFYQPVNKFYGFTSFNPLGDSDQLLNLAVNREVCLTEFDHLY